jgi:hypothetical protein
MFDVKPEASGTYTTCDPSTAGADAAGCPGKNVPSFAGLKQVVSDPAPVMAFTSMRQNPSASSETHQLLFNHNTPRGCVTPDASKTARFAAVGFGDGT